MNLRKIKIFYQVLQIILGIPFLLMWLGIFRFYQNHSAGLLELYFPLNWWTPLTSIGFPAAAIVLGIIHLWKTFAEKYFDWSLNILLCLFAAISVFAIVGQITNL